MTFQLDEHVDHAIAAGLKLRGIDVTTSTEAGLLGASDEEQIQFALSQGRVFLTQDEDFLVLAARGVPHAGIGYWHPNTRTIGEIIRRVVTLHNNFTQNEMHGQVQYL